MPKSEKFRKLTRDALVWATAVLFILSACVGHGSACRERGREGKGEGERQRETEEPEHLVWARLRRLHVFQTLRQRSKSASRAGRRRNCPRRSLGTSAGRRMRAAPRGLAVLFPPCVAPGSPEFTWRQFEVSAVGMEQVDELELLMEKSFGDNAAQPAEL